MLSITFRKLLKLQPNSKPFPNKRSFKIDLNILREEFSFVPRNSLENPNVKRPDISANVCAELDFSEKTLCVNEKDTKTPILTLYLSQTALSLYPVCWTPIKSSFDNVLVLIDCHFHVNPSS